jgi:hypothetical protein
MIDKKISAVFSQDKKADDTQGKKSGQREHGGV